MSLRHTISPNTQLYILSFLLLTLVSPVTPLALHNITIALPIGSSDHGIPGLLCTPTKPLDLLIFYLLNYIAHAATVLTRPGERADDYIVSVIGTLLFPTLGLYRGIEAILCGAVFVKNDDLRKAARSGALCCVVRGADWRPMDGESISNVVLKRSTRDIAGGGDVASRCGGADDEVGENGERQIHVIPYSPPYMFTRFGCPVFAHRRIIHGTHSLPEGYRFAIVPHDTQFTTTTTSNTTSPSSSPSTSPSSPADSPTIEVSATYNLIKALIALAQSAYALSTLYRSRGDQISQFGYAAFGLTVAPYAVMSIMNLIGTLCRPEYPSLYMVESSVMDEARQRGAIFSGAVSRMKEDAGTTEGREGSVCACGFAEGEDIDEVRIVTNKSTGELEASVGMVDALAYVQTVEKLDDDDDDDDDDTYIDRNPASKSTVSALETKTQSQSQSLSTSPAPSTHPTTLLQSLPIAPLPDKLNYTSTHTSPLLLIPSHPPITRSQPTAYISSPSISFPSPPLRPAISTLRLTRTYPFRRHYTWSPTFSPTPASIAARRWRILKYFLTTFISLLPVLITGTMSHGFEEGAIPKEESSTWRVFTVQWMSFGVFTGLWWVLEQEGKDGVGDVGVQIGPWARAVGYFVSASPAVGGYVVVGQMLYRYGVCAWVGD
ncbi:Nn.00g005590.m01.CDS01 [Neocucurbitaria sp. VM-36]